MQIFDRSLLMFKRKATTFQIFMPKFCIFGTSRMKTMFPLDERTDTEVKVGKANMCSCRLRCTPTWVYKTSWVGTSV